MTAATDRLVAIGTSAGGIPALQQLLGELPADFPAPVVIVQHIHPDRRSMLAEVLGRSSALPVVQAQEGGRPEAGTVYVAPPDVHLVLTADGRFGVTHADRVRFSRPSVDVLFRSVADHVGDRAIAVVLTGMGSDGADGVLAVKESGGTVLAQDAAAAFASMPDAARATGVVDHVLPLDEIAAMLCRLLDHEAVT